MTSSDGAPSEQAPEPVLSERLEPPPKGRLVGALRWVFGLVLEVALLLLIVLGAKFSVADWYEIPSESMLPTIQVGDRVMVNKVAFSLRLPFSGQILLQTGEPRRGDIVVFLYPGDRKTDYIKRVIGLPGDQIEIREDVLYINGQAVTLSESSAERLSSGAVLEAEARLHLETLDDVHHFIMTHERPSADVWDFSKLTENAAEMLCPLEGNRVPPDCFFMMGDNRPKSADSRSWGFVPRSYLKGRAFAVALSFEKPVWNVSGYRLSRWFSRLDPRSEP